MRLRANGRRDTPFGNNGITYPLLGRPPGGDPIYTTLDAIDANGPRRRVHRAGPAAPGPGTAASARQPPGGSARSYHRPLPAGLDRAGGYAP